ncbi:MAG: cation-translocating P-type ATPase, partial [Gemmatimonadota bacterium]
MLDRLDTTADGLTGDEAHRRLDEYGPNRLSAPARVSPWSILVDQFRSLVVLLLLGATAVAFVIGDRIEAAAIAVVLILNTAIGFVVEFRARRAMEALLRYRVPTARVLRDGAVAVIDADGLVPGDILELEAGDAVPADARLIAGSGVRANEASLTGESVPSDKTVPASPADTPLPDRGSMIYTGTALVSGRGRAVVVATGSATELGRVGTLLEGVEEGRTPLERRLDALGRRLVGVTLGVAALVVALGVVRGSELRLMIETGLALAIAAVPEGLPAVVTIALAVGLRRMARRKALVRRLAAVESLGSTTVICTDKTGTLTAGEMTVTAVVMADAEVTVSGTGYVEDGDLAVEATDGGGEGGVSEPAPALEHLLRAAALTPRAHLDPEGTVTGDPTDAALLVLARKGGFDPDELRREGPETGEIPFSSETRMSASFHGDGGGAIAYVKGAPEAVLERSTRAATLAGETAMDDRVRTRIEERNRELAEEGLRVIALAYARGDGATTELPADLVFLGLAAMIDPAATGVRDTLGRFRDAGIRTVMITGDQSVTAAAVARSLGLATDAESTVD